jgi:hypothetical protein
MLLRNIFIIIFLLVIIIIYIIPISIFDFGNKAKKWTRPKTCKYMMPSNITNSLNALNIKHTNDYKKADIIFPCGYNDINTEINGLPNVYNAKDYTNPKNVFIIDGADEFSAKNNLWTHILNYYGYEKAKELSPNTFILNNKDDLIRLEKEHNINNIYIMKKNIQRQEGLLITRDIELIKKSQEYAVAQILLQNPYLINGLKINLRVYILVTCHKDTTNIYVFNNGFMYYTKQPFVKNSMETDNNITTGYVERKVYTENPLTHEDFKYYLDLTEGEHYHKNNIRSLNNAERQIKQDGFLLSQVVFNNIMILIRDVFMSFKGKICKSTSQIYKDNSYQIFGADVAISDKLQAQIIEINKGPDLDAKDERDKMVKTKLTNDMFELIGLREISNDNGFINVLSR